MIHDELNVLFLGGLGEVGKNLLVLEFADDIIVVDAGIGFPEEELLGVDVLLPDIDYLRQRADRVRGIFITHGHEDHIGALPYLLAHVDAPVYSTPLTEGLIRARLKEHGLADRADLRAIEPEDDPRIVAGCFSVECFRVCHSIPDAVGFAIETPAGLVVVTGDFKLDPEPVDGRATDLNRIDRFARRSPLLLISDCVHVESPGVTPPEALVEQTLDGVFGRSQGRIILATFASSLSRIQQVLDVAYLHDRKVACFGRSMQNNVRVALELGYLEPPPDTLVRPGELRRLPPEQVVCLCTGSQGEPMAVLNRISRRNHAQIQIEEGDTVIISATPIPGNETSVFRVIDRLFEQGADVIYSSRALVHVSGHASRDELRAMLERVKPRFVLPTHGEPRHLRLYAQLARETGMPDDRILLGRNGTRFGYDGETWRVDDEQEVGTIFVGAGTGREGYGADRRAGRIMARDGVVSVGVTLDRTTGALLADPQIVTRGFDPATTDGRLLDTARRVLRRMLVEATDDDADDGLELLSSDDLDASMNEDAVEGATVVGV